MADCYCLGDAPRFGVAITEEAGAAYTATATYEVFDSNETTLLLSGNCTMNADDSRGYYYPALSAANGFARGRRYLSVITVTMTVAGQDVVRCHRQFFHICTSG